MCCASQVHPPSLLEFIENGSHSFDNGILIFLPLPSGAGAATGELHAQGGAAEVRAISYWCFQEIGISWCIQSRNTKAIAALVTRRSAVTYAPAPFQLVFGPGHNWGENRQKWFCAVRFEGPPNQDLDRHQIKDERLPNIQLFFWEGRCQTIIKVAGERMTKAVVWCHPSNLQKVMHLRFAHIHAWWCQDLLGINFAPRTGASAPCHFSFCRCGKNYLTDYRTHLGVLSTSHFGQNTSCNCAGSRSGIVLLRCRGLR